MFHKFSCTMFALLSLLSIVSHAQDKPKLTVYTYDAFAAWFYSPLIPSQMDGIELRGNKSACRAKSVVKGSKHQKQPTNR